MHTPRLCIDARDQIHDSHGVRLNQELVDQLVSFTGEENNRFEWFERHRVVLLCHPSQVFTGQLKRYETNHLIGRGLFSRIWDTRFFRRSHTSLIHRFRTINNYASLKSAALTTLVPSSHHERSSFRAHSEELFIVPSDANKAWLVERGVQADAVFSIVPGPRRFVHYTNPVIRPLAKEVGLFFDSQETLERAKQLVRKKIPDAVLLPISLTDSSQFQNIAAYWQLLNRLSFAVYLTEKRMDWALPFWEMLYWRIPVFFDRHHKTISQHVPELPFTLEDFTDNEVDPSRWKSQLAQFMASEKMREQFGEFFLAKQFSEIYRINLPV